MFDRVRAALAAFTTPPTWKTPAEAPVPVGDAATIVSLEVSAVIRCACGSLTPLRLRTVASIAACQRCGRLSSICYLKYHRQNPSLPARRMDIRVCSVPGLSAPDHHSS